MVDNTKYGDHALENNLTGNKNSAFGTNALKDNETGHTNTAVGAFALNNAKNLHENTAFGSHALEENINGENTAIGAWAGSKLQSGGNTAVGAWAMRYCMTGSNNTVIGHRAMASTATENDDSTAYGSGEYNTVIGSNALRNNDTGNSNTVVGARSMQSNVSGSHNVAIGDNSLTSLENGEHHTALGDNTGMDVTGGEQCTFLGKSSGCNNDSEPINRTAIGYNAQAECDNSVVIGNDDVHVGIGTNKPEHKLHVVGNVCFEGDTKAEGNLNVTGDSTLKKTEVDGNLDVTGESCLTGDTEVKSNLNVTCNATIGGHIISNIKEFDNDIDLTEINNLYLIVCNTTGGSIIVTLPNPSNNEGRILIVLKKVPNNILSVKCNSASDVNNIIDNYYGTFTYLSYCDKWYLLSETLRDDNLCDTTTIEPTTTAAP